MRALTKPGMHADGAGLYLRVTKAARWGGGATLIAAADWPAVLICASWPRLNLGGALAAYDLTGEVILTGRKESSRLRAYVQR